MSQFQPTDFLTPTGRIVYSGGDRNSLYEPKTTDYDGNPLLIKNGPDAGKPTQRYEFGLAIPKERIDTATGQKTVDAHWASHPALAAIWAQGHRDHPHSASRPDFAWKVTDGDSKVPGRVKNGKPARPPCEKEGYPGHWVLSFSSAYAIRFLNANGTQQLLDKGAVKVGDYVQVAGNVVGNTGATPGVYLNPQFVALQGYGAAIQNGPDPATLGFGGGPAPAGMSPIPVGGMTTPPASLPPPPAAAAPAPLPPAAPVAAPAPLPSPVAPPVPAPAALPPPVVVQPNAAILAPPPPAAPPAPLAPQMTAKATATYDAYRAAGWTDEQLRANGLIV